MFVARAYQLASLPNTHGWRRTFRIGNRRAQQARTSSRPPAALLGQQRDGIDNSAGQAAGSGSGCAWVLRMIRVEGEDLLLKYPQEFTAARGSRQSHGPRESTDG